MFPDTGHINVSNVPHEGEIELALDYLAEAADLCLECTKKAPRRIVNSTFVGSVSLPNTRPSTLVYRTLSLYAKGGREAEQRHGARVNRRSQFFPGVRIKWERLPGTVQLFNTGRYVIVGVRGREEALRLRTKLCALMREFSTTTAPPT